MTRTSGLLERGHIIPADRGAAAFYDDLARYTGQQSALPAEIHIWPALNPVPPEE